MGHDMFTSKYTRSKVLTERRCGLTKWDRAVESTSRERVIEYAINASERFPEVWGGGWANLDWAFANACGDLGKHGGQWTCNLDDFLTEEELEYIRSVFDLVPYSSDAHRNQYKREKRTA